MSRFFFGSRRCSLSVQVIGVLNIDLFETAFADSFIISPLFLTGMLYNDFYLTQCSVEVCYHQKLAGSGDFSSSLVDDLETSRPGHGGGLYCEGRV
ncbi:unnamed protein product [Rhizophagus irregularis]|nr:unnamed protein product [Rhizophagus irregularis]CAB5394358.1 unnamed protein product [Rhizophagus irregularis]